MPDRESSVCDVDHGGSSARHPSCYHQYGDNRRSCRPLPWQEAHHQGEPMDVQDHQEKLAGQRRSCQRDLAVIHNRSGTPVVPAEIAATMAGFRAQSVMDRRDVNLSPDTL